MSTHRIVPADRLTRRGLTPQPAPLGESRPFELALDGPLPRRTCSLQVHPDDKAVFDALQHWWALHSGRKLTQWELFTLVLDAAVANAEGRFADARLPGA